MKKVMVKASVVMLLSSFQAHAQFGFGDLKDKLLGGEKKEEAQQGPVTMESEYPINDVFAKLDPLLAIYGSAVLQYMQGYEAFLSAYGNKTLAGKAKALIDDLNNGAALDSDMIDRITITSEELGAEIQTLETENIELDEEGKKQFAGGLENFINGVGQTYVLVRLGPAYVQNIKNEAASSLLGGTMAFATLRTMGKIAINMPGNVELIYNNLTMIIKYSRSNDIPLPPSVDEVMAGFSL